MPSSKPVVRRVQVMGKALARRKKLAAQLDVRRDAPRRA